MQVLEDILHQLNGILFIAHLRLGPQLHLDEPTGLCMVSFRPKHGALLPLGKELGLQLDQSGARVARGCLLRLKLRLI